MRAGALRSQNSVEPKLVGVEEDLAGAPHRSDEKLAPLDLVSLPHRAHTALLSLHFGEGLEVQLDLANAREAAAAEDTAGGALLALQRLLLGTRPLLCNANWQGWDGGHELHARAALEISLYCSFHAKSDNMSLSGSKLDPSSRFVVSKLDPSFPGSFRNYARRFPLMMTSTIDYQNRPNGHVLLLAIVPCGLCSKFLL